MVPIVASKKKFISYTINRDNSISLLFDKKYLSISDKDISLKIWNREWEHIYLQKIDVIKNQITVNINDEIQI